MKKYVILAGISAIAFACGNQAADDKKTDAATEQTVAAGPSAEDEKGIELIAGSDCLTCHKVNEKSIGPSYQDVANKYTKDEATITMLAGKILQGGSGVWGEIAMTPHPQVSEEDAKTMVKYILSLKTN